MMTKKLTITGAIAQAMRMAEEPLSPKEAYRRVVEMNLYEFNAQNPEAVVRSQIRRHCKDLDFPSAAPTKYFGMTEDGEFYSLENPVEKNNLIKKAGKQPLSQASTGGLVSTLDSLKDLHQRHRDLIKKHILSEIKKLSPYVFEQFARKLLEAYGFKDMEVTSANNDGGIDGYGKLKIGLAYMKVAFQCKRWTKSSVGRPEIDKFRGAIQGEYEQGIFFTTAKFTPGAQRVSFKSGAVPIILLDGPSIVDFMIQENFGVTQDSLPVYTYALDMILAAENDTL
jgi:restriction system protein